MNKIRNIVILVLFTSLSLAGMDLPEDWTVNPSDFGFSAAAE